MNKLNQTLEMRCLSRIPTPGVYSRNTIYRPFQEPPKTYNDVLFTFSGGNCRKVKTIKMSEERLYITFRLVTKLHRRSMLLSFPRQETSNTYLWVKAINQLGGQEDFDSRAYLLNYPDGLDTVFKADVTDYSDLIDEIKDILQEGYDDGIDYSISISFMLPHQINKQLKRPILTPSPRPTVDVQVTQIQLLEGNYSPKIETPKRRDIQIQEAKRFAQEQEYTNWLFDIYQENLTTARVIRINDGDGLILSVSSSCDKIKCRLAYIDAPEKNQRDGSQALLWLKDLLEEEKEIIKVILLEEDKHNRAIAEVFIDGISLNWMMVFFGYAHVYPKYIYEDERKRIYEETQQRAKDLKLGLWEYSNAIHPEEFRRNHSPRESFYDIYIRPNIHEPDPDDRGGLEYL